MLVASVETSFKAAKELSPKTRMVSEVHCVGIRQVDKIIGHRVEGILMNTRL